MLCLPGCANIEDKSASTESNFSTTKVHNTDARFLNLENDTSVIYVDITSSLIDNQVVEYTEVLVRPEFSKYYTDGIFKNGIYQVNAQVVI